MTQTTTRTQEIVSTPIVNVSPILFDGSQEIWASYERADDQRMIMSILSPGKHDQGALFLGEAIQQVDIAARELVTLSLLEARILRDLLNRPDVQAVLDAQP